MSMFNTKTGEEKSKGLILHVRGTFRMDMSMDEVLIWDPETNACSIEYLCGDWYAEVDASEKTIKNYYSSIRSRQLVLDDINTKAKKLELKVGSKIKVIRGKNIEKDYIGHITKVFNDNYNTIFVDGKRTYARNVQIEVNGLFKDPQTYVKQVLYFQAI